MRVGSNYAGCRGDIGGFSLNYHKHIHCGEGGVLVTDNDDLALRMRLIRNHGEAAQEGLGTNYTSNWVNFRLGEIECAIASEQMKAVYLLQGARKLLIGCRSSYAIPNITLPKERTNCTHVYYLFPIILKGPLVAKEKIINALAAEGVEGVMAGYQLIHRSLYQRKLGYGKHEFPWSLSDRVDYTKTTCRNTEFYRKVAICFEMCLHELGNDDLKKLIKAFKKVF